MSRVPVKQDCRPSADMEMSDLDAGLFASEASESRGRVVYMFTDFQLGQQCDAYLGKTFALSSKCLAGVLHSGCDLFVQ